MGMPPGRLEIQPAIPPFPNVETYTTPEGGLFLKAALQTTVGRMYGVQLTFVGYPLQMPRVFVIAPAISHNKHRYNTGHVCYMHPDFWNPARHNLIYVLAQVAVWLNKHEVYLATSRWPGPGLPH